MNLSNKPFLQQKKRPANPQARPISKNPSETPRAIKVHLSFIGTWCWRWRLAFRGKRGRLPRKPIYSFSFKMAVGLGAPPNLELSAIAINGGTMIKVARVDKPRPPNTTTPIPRYNSDPAPGKITSGTRPKK